VKALVVREAPGTACPAWLLRARLHARSPPAVRLVCRFRKKRCERSTRRGSSFQPPPAPFSPREMAKKKKAPVEEAPKKKGKKKAAAKK